MSSAFGEPPTPGVSKSADAAGATTSERGGDEQQERARARGGGERFRSAGQERRILLGRRRSGPIVAVRAPRRLAGALSSPVNPAPALLQERLTPSTKSADCGHLLLDLRLELELLVHARRSSHALSWRLVPA